MAQQTLRDGHGDHADLGKASAATQDGDRAFITMPNRDPWVLPSLHW